VRKTGGRLGRPEQPEPNLLGSGSLLPVTFPAAGDDILHDFRPARHRGGRDRRSDPGRGISAAVLAVILVPDINVRPAEIHRVVVVFDLDIVKHLRTDGSLIDTDTLRMMVSYSATTSTFSWNSIRMARLQGTT